MTLDKLPLGKAAVITKVGGEGALRCRLLDMGIIPKTKVMIRKVAPMGDPIELQIRGYELTIRIDDAKKIEVEESVLERVTALSGAAVVSGTQPEDMLTGSDYPPVIGCFQVTDYLLSGHLNHI